MIYTIITGFVTKKYRKTIARKEFFSRYKNTNFPDVDKKIK
jgi:hypothetical protein